MFLSPQEQAMLKITRKELHSGVTPHQFGLETLKYSELRDHAAEYGSLPTIEKTPPWKHLSKTISVWIEIVRQYLSLSAPAR